MDMRRYFDRLFAYNHWANRETLSSLRSADPPPPRSMGFIAHIVAGERLWLGRLKQDPKAVAVWPDLTLDECEEGLADLRRVWQDYLDRLTAETLSRRIPYTNTKGESWTNTVEDILMHVVLHSAYHRAQIASDLRLSGKTPAYTDFIHSVRQGFVE